MIKMNLEEKEFLAINIAKEIEHNNKHHNKPKTTAAPFPASITCNK